MREPAIHTAEDATPAELRRMSRLLLAMLLALALLVVPLIRELPLGRSTRTGILAALLVGLAFYWLYKGMGYRPLLLIQLLLFSAAAVLLSAKILLVIVDVHRLALLRQAAKVLILLGAGCAGVNAAGMLLALFRRRAAQSRA
jgi:hypothetical protein